MDADEIADILSNVKYKNWTLRYVMRLPMSIQWLFSVGGETQRGREWFISNRMTKSEIVSTAFKAALTAEEHECREAFRYKDKKIYGPHFDVDVLAEIAGKKVNLDITVPRMPKELAPVAFTEWDHSDDPVA